MENQTLTESNNSVTDVTSLGTSEVETSSSGTESGQSLESIEGLGKTLLESQLAVIEAVQTTVTLGGFIKALKLALVHEVAPEMQTMELNEKQQFMAAHIAKAIDLVYNLKMTQMGIQMKNEGKLNDNE
jgi:hypothetical protein